MIERLFEKIYNLFLKKKRIKFTADKINNLSIENLTLLDIGCQDCFLKDNVKFNYTGIDLIKIKDNAIEGDIEKINIKEKYDIVVCLETLEHLKNPVLVMNKIKSIATKYIIVSVPHEPQYTSSRLFKLCREHYWTITPELLKIHFGEPIQEYYWNFKRHYIGIFKK